MSKTRCVILAAGMIFGTQTMAQTFRADSYYQEDPLQSGEGKLQFQDNTINKKKSIEVNKAKAPAGVKYQK